MYKNKLNIVIVCLILLFSIMFVSTAPTQESNNGYAIRTAIPNYLEKDAGFDAHAHVFLQSDGTYTTDATCYLHLYTKDGHHLFEGYDNAVSHDWDYSWDLSAGNFSEVGTHTYVIQCNGSVGVDNYGGFISGEYYVNGYGEELTQGISFNFNMAMLFLMILFSMSLIGCIKSDHYIVKFALYWVCHLIFIAGTFSVWQFSEGFGISYMGLAGIYKVLFYVSTIAVLPALLLSLAWIFYIHTYNEHFQKLVEKGEDPENAFKMTEKKKGGGWFNGR